jgi:hypothetical protein
LRSIGQEYGILSFFASVKLLKNLETDEEFLCRKPEPKKQQEQPAQTGVTGAARTNGLSIQGTPGAVIIVPGQIRNGLPENIPVIRCATLGPDQLALVTPKAKQSAVKGVSVANASAPAKQTAKPAKKTKRAKLVRKIKTSKRLRKPSNPTHHQTALQPTQDWVAVSFHPTSSCQRPKHWKNPTFLDRASAASDRRCG